MITPNGLPACLLVVSPSRALAYAGHTVGAEQKVCGRHMAWQVLSGYSFGWLGF